ncbi:hypothetical protein [Pseudomonas fluorescens]|jgi:hypothetical protein|uniref:hypothetical protein n=1 Tax=Pseudomonas fluorescens TaxID=294 RepID=UPI0011CE7F03|nr:hypothetical protein [Pseudomonas fluorescens]
MDNQKSLVDEIAKLNKAMAASREATGKAKEQKAAVEMAHIQQLLAANPKADVSAHLARYMDAW